MSDQLQVFFLSKVFQLAVSVCYHLARRNMTLSELRRLKKVNLAGRVANVS